MTIKNRLINALIVVAHQMTYEKWKADLGAENFATFEESYGPSDDDDEEAYEEELDREVKDFFQQVVLDLPTAFPLEIYRAVCLKSFDDLNKNEFGVHWSTEEALAKCYNDGEGDEYVFTATVPSEAIDWVRTIYHRIEDRFQNYTESEINLLEGKKITVSLKDSNDEFEATV